MHALRVHEEQRRWVADGTYYSCLSTDDGTWHPLAGQREHDMMADTRETADVAARSVLLTPPEAAPVPDTLRRSDGSSAFRATNSARYTSRDLLDAEARLVPLLDDIG
jgi:hypothetical protein